jgi:hypothetical protein
LTGGRGGVARTLAVIVDVARRVDVSAVAASIDTIRWFALGSGGSRSCAWHAARVHHRCRNLFPPDNYISAFLHFCSIQYIYII